jgi:hypothetical protein
MILPNIDSKCIHLGIPWVYLGFTYGTYVFPMIYVLYPYFILIVFLGKFIRILILLFGKMELDKCF